MASQREAYGEPVANVTVTGDGTTKVEWIQTRSMPMDSLTKKMRDDQLMKDDENGKSEVGSRMHVQEGF